MIFSGSCSKRPALNDLSAGEVVRAGHRRENLAKIDELGFQTLDFQTNGPAAGKCHRDSAGRSVVFGEFDGKKIEHGILATLIETATLARDNAFEAESRAAAPVFRRFDLERVGIDRVHPVKAVDRHDETAFARTPKNVANLDEGVLQVSGHDLDIILIQGDELKFLHDRVPLPASVVQN